MLTKELGMSWCLEQPCLARNEHCCIMLHVDDVMFCGDASYWSDVFLQKLKDKYKISFSKLEDVGSEISFLKRKLKRLETVWPLFLGQAAQGSSKPSKLTLERPGNSRFHVMELFKQKISVHFSILMMLMFFVQFWGHCFTCHVTDRI